MYKCTVVQTLYRSWRVRCVVMSHVPLYKCTIVNTPLICGTYLRCKGSGAPRAELCLEVFVDASDVSHHRLPVRPLLLDHVLNVLEGR